MTNKELFKKLGESFTIQDVFYKLGMINNRPNALKVAKYLRGHGYKSSVKWLNNKAVRRWSKIV